MERRPSADRVARVHAHALRQNHVQHLAERVLHINIILHKLQLLNKTKLHKNLSICLGDMMLSLFASRVKNCIRLFVSNSFLYTKA